jgi:glycosyltransferase 2 family protein
MSQVVNSFAQAFRGKIGWNFVAVAISLLIMAMAAVTLFKLFREIEVDKIIIALKAEAPYSIFIAAGFVVAGYCVLTCYDLFALRAIGWSAVPYRVAAFASFTSYTIGHNLGAPTFTSGVIRYRIYSAWGLSAIDIARIAFITGLTYWLGAAVVLGCGVSYAPDIASAVDRLSAPINRLIGASVLMVIAGYILWLAARPRVIGRANWRIRLPNPRATSAQIAIGALDLTCVAAAMYTLLPAQPSIRFLDLVVIFVTAMSIGVVSHAPGGLGVIEAAMFVGLPQFRREDLLASILIFRVLYFVLPLLLAVIMLGVVELRIVVERALGAGRQVKGASPQ